MDMKKMKEMLRTIGTAGLAAIMLTAQLPVTAFAEEITEPQAVVMDELQQDEILPDEDEYSITEETVPNESGGDITETPEDSNEEAQDAEPSDYRKGRIRE